MMGLKQLLKYWGIALLFFGGAGTAAAVTFTIPIGGAPFVAQNPAALSLTASAFPSSNPLGGAVCLSDPSCFGPSLDSVIFNIHVGQGPLGPLHVELGGLAPSGAGYLTGAGVVPASATLGGQGASFDIGLASGQNTVSLFFSFPAGSISGSETLRLVLATPALADDELETDEGDSDHPHDGRHSRAHDDDSDSDSDGDSDFGFEGDVLIAEVGIVPLPVPEPGTLLLLSGGLLATLQIRRR